MTRLSRCFSRGRRRKRRGWNEGARFERSEESRGRSNTLIVSPLGQRDHSCAIFTMLMKHNS